MVCFPMTDNDLCLLIAFMVRQSALNMGGNAHNYFGGKSSVLGYFMGKRGRNSDADFDFSYRDLNVMGLWVAPFQMLVVFMLWTTG